MTGVEVVLAINVAVGSLFAAGYAIIAVTNAWDCGSRSAT